MRTMNAEILVKVMRGSLAESVHRGHAAVVNADGELLFFAGNPEYATFARSAAKPLQAIPIVESGAADHFKLNERDIALLCSSHNGETAHVEAVEQLLNKIGLSAGNLQCGAHYPYHTASADRLKQRNERPTAIHNNCSGKHTGMLAYAVHKGYPLDNYLSLEHAVQQSMLQTVSEMCGLNPAELQLGTDGCGVPVFGMPLSRLAFAYARLGFPEQLPAAKRQACRTIIRALRENPFYLAGSSRFDTRLIESSSGRIIGKMGAEGVFALCVPDERIGIAVKVEDGTMRALYPAVVEIVRQLGLIAGSQLDALESFHTPVQTNWRGDRVGIIVPDFRLYNANGQTDGNTKRGS